MNSHRNRVFDAWQTPTSFADFAVVTSSGKPSFSFVGLEPLGPHVNGQLHVHAWLVCPHEARESICQAIDLRDLNVVAPSYRLSLK